MENPYSWHKLTHVVWVEQPIGTGFSQGNVTATSEEDVAAQFRSWFKNFVDTFGMQGYKIYIAGESYAGQFVPYIASGFLDTNDTTYYDLQGIMVYDPSIAYDDLQAEITTLPFVETWSGERPRSPYVHQVTSTDWQCRTLRSQRYLPCGHSCS